VSKIHALTSGDLPIIGVGGISNALDARSKLDAGAVLIQIYTGLIYQGPGLVKNILKDLNN
jgi:dihydroorotate dehydrogenase